MDHIQFRHEGIGSAFVGSGADRRIKGDQEDSRPLIIISFSGLRGNVRKLTRVHMSGRDLTAIFSKDFY